MKKLFVVGFLLGIHSICISSGKAQAAETMHNRHLEWDKGIVIYYPQKYKSYEDFKKSYLEKEYVVELLDERLKLLGEINVVGEKMDHPPYDANDEEKYERYRNDLILNEIALRSNATSEVLDFIPFTQNDVDSNETLYKQQFESITSLLRSLHTTQVPVPASSPKK
jgi:hypothetical protein